jgi:hypothetical protein
LNRSHSSLRPRQKPAIARAPDRGNSRLSRHWVAQPHDQPQAAQVDGAAGARGK